MLHSLFAYLNRMWIKRSVEENVANVSDINSSCLMLWKEVLFGQVRERLIPALLGVVLKDRKGETIDFGLVQKICNSFGTISMINFVRYICLF
jgi:cullin 1